MLPAREWIWIALGLFHLAVTAVAIRPGIGRSRWLLAATLCAAIPLAGPLLALLVRRVRGAGLAHRDDDEAWVPPRPSAADVRQLAELPPIVDRLMSPDIAERQTAMLQIIGSGGTGAITVLRWVIEHGTPDVVLEAALALDEIDQRALAAGQRSAS